MFTISPAKREEALQHIISDEGQVTLGKMIGQFAELRRCLSKFDPKVADFIIAKTLGEVLGNEIGRLRERDPSGKTDQAFADLVTEARDDVLNIFDTSAIPPLPDRMLAGYFASVKIPDGVRAAINRTLDKIQTEIRQDRGEQ